jgi:hypothetical protein
LTAIVSVFAEVNLSLRGVGGSTAARAEDFMRSYGFNGASTTSNVPTALAYTGSNTLRTSDWTVVRYPALAASWATAGIQFEVFASNNPTCNDTATNIRTHYLNGLHRFVAAHPNSIRFLEGGNEVNVWQICFMENLTTNASTSSGNVLHFATVPNWLQAVSTGGTLDAVNALGQFTVTDTTTPSAIPAGTHISSITGTTVTLSQAVAATVGSSDTIHFIADKQNPASNIAFQQVLYDAYHNDSVFSGIPVINYEDYPEYGKVPGSADFNNSHWYPYYADMPVFLGVETGQIAGLRTAYTEFGYATLPNHSNGVDEATQAIYFLEALFDFHRRNVPVTLFYSLMNDSNFGVFENDQVTPKPAATALHNLHEVMHDTGVTALTFTPGQLSYSVDGLPVYTTGSNGPYGVVEKGGFTQLYEKSNGRFYIIIYSSPWLWNVTTDTPVTPPTYLLTVRLGSAATTINVYDPITGTSPIATYSNQASIPLTLISHPFIVEVIP